MMSADTRTAALDASRFLPLHPLEFRILMALLEGPSFGTRIVQQIEERESGRMHFYPANLFRRIRDLMSKGLLEETQGPDGADPRRTYLRLTPMGSEVVRAEALRLHELVRDAASHDLLPER